MSSRWIETIKNSVIQQTEQRRGLLQPPRSLRSYVFLFYLAEMKQRSASLDHSAHAHRRHLQHRATVTIRTP